MNVAAQKLINARVWKIMSIGLLLSWAMGLHAQGLKPFQADNKVWGYKDQSGKVVIPPKFINASGFSEGLAAVELLANAHWGFIDKTGRTVIPFEYKSAGYL